MNLQALRLKGIVMRVMESPITSQVSKGNFSHQDELQFQMMCVLAHIKIILISILQT
jgi:hypothetical protein